MAKVSIACVALDGRTVLIAHRNPTGDMGGRWEFPGGKVEEGESEQDAVRREFQEEFGVDVTVGELVARAAFDHHGQRFELRAYRVFVPHPGTAVPYRLSEHTGYEWIDIDRIPERSFVDSDLLLYPEVRRYVLSQEGIPT